MLVQFSIVPLGSGESISEGVAEVIRIVDESGLPYKTNPMGTVVEGGWDEVMALIRKCHEEVLRGASRVLTSISIDDRPGKPDRITGKVQSIEKRLGREIRK
ncbi:MAG: MTH1187 family thiamine-binding protein [Deltaproteobacteria bacterium]|nr:MTH1187 family thiamine-binding protein [Deltaproteobacteria bacterium]